MPYVLVYLTSPFLPTAIMSSCVQREGGRGREMLIHVMSCHGTCPLSCSLEEAQERVRRASCPAHDRHAPPIGTKREWAILAAVHRLIALASRIHKCCLACLYFSTRTGVAFSAQTSISFFLLSPCLFSVFVPSGYHSMVSQAVRACVCVCVRRQTKLEVGV